MKNIAKYTGLIIGISLLTLFIFGIGNAKEEYKPLTPAAQQTYDLWYAQGCNLVKVLAQAKWEDHSHGINFDGANWNDIDQKRNQECKGFKTGSLASPQKLARANEIQRQEKITSRKSASESGVDLNKLAYAVAQAETSNCTTGVGKTRNNCFGIQRQGGFVRYSNSQESYEDFKTIWSKHYGGFPTITQARKYTNNDRAEGWLNIVNHYYYK